MLQYIATVILADVIAMWQMESPLVPVLYYSLGRCYCHVADGKATTLVFKACLLVSGEVLLPIPP